MYAGLGLSAIVFITHGLILHGWEIQKHRMSLEWMALMAGLNITGAVAYASRVSIHLSFLVYQNFILKITQVPERWYPLRHDIYGSSHQILHFMVIFAALAHMFGLLRAFDHLHVCFDVGWFRRDESVLECAERGVWFGVLCCDLGKNVSLSS